MFKTVYQTNLKNFFTKKFLTQSSFIINWISVLTTTQINFLIKNKNGGQTGNQAFLDSQNE